MIAASLCSWQLDAVAGRLLLRDDLLAPCWAAGRYDLRDVQHLNAIAVYRNRTPVGWIISASRRMERIAQLLTWGMIDITWAA
jgi:hypothetical protein